MATYLFGDIQGCYDPLMRLLEHINYDPTQDQLGFVGDLINRGPQSLEALRFIRNLENPLVVLGNHDITLLALSSNSLMKHKNHTLKLYLACLKIVGKDIMTL